MLAIGCAFTSQAVVIHWAVTTAVGGATTAALVYVGTGGTPPTWTGTSFTGGTQIGTSAEALPDNTVGAQASLDSAALQAGGYYVVLFNSGATQYKLSTTWLSYDDKVNGSGSPIDAMTIDPQFPAQNVFDPAFGDWIPVPEPSTLALLAIGAAAMACRRRKQG